MNTRIAKIRPTALGLVSLLTLVVPQAARAEDPYCARARARAGSDSALLYAPTVRVEGVKLPSGLQKGGQLEGLPGRDRSHIVGHVASLFAS